LQFSQNGLSNPLGIAQDRIVPEPDYTPSLGLEPSGAPRILLVVKVLAAICLNNQKVFSARKIGDERPDRDLPAELIAS